MPVTRDMTKERAALTLPASRVPVSAPFALSASVELSGVIGGLRLSFP